MTIPRLISLSLLACAAACVPGTKSLGSDTVADDGDVVAGSSSSGAVEEETLGATSIGEEGEGGATEGPGTGGSETSAGTGAVDCDTDACTCAPECEVISACFDGNLQCGCDCSEGPTIDPTACEASYPSGGSCSTAEGGPRPDLPQIALPAPSGLAPNTGPQAGGSFDCDTYAQDCPDGDRCVPYANDGGTAWNATGCFPIAAEPHAIGDSCLVIGSGVSGEDTCGKGAMCWDPDPQTNVGTCVELCGCNAANPICQTQDTICTLADDGVLALCLDVCNPLDTTGCGSDFGCYAYEDAFVCVPDVSEDGAGEGSPCQFINGCPAGMACVDDAGEPIGATGNGTCTSFCELGGDACGDGTCQDWYESEPPGACLGTVGSCG